LRAFLSFEQIAVAIDLDGIKKAILVLLQPVGQRGKISGVVSVIPVRISVIHFCAIAPRKFPGCSKAEFVKAFTTVLNPSKCIARTYTYPLSQRIVLFPDDFPVLTASLQVTATKSANLIVM